jgi:Ca2+-binding EF-hand superfamily protein
VELKEEERKAAKEMFTKMDVDKSGKLEVAELHSVLQKLGLDIPLAQFEAYSGKGFWV